MQVGKMLANESRYIRPRMLAIIVQATAGVMRTATLY
jgi:hypothetical protein